MKRIGKLKVSPRTIGKILETESGVRLMIVEQKGRDIWRGKHKSLNDAIQADEAFIGVDRILLQRAKTYGVVNVMVVVEELCRIFVAPIDMMLDHPEGRSRPNWQGRAHRLLPWKLFLRATLGPNLKVKRNRANA